MPNFRFQPFRTIVGWSRSQRFAAGNLIGNTALSPLTALEVAQHHSKLRIMLEHRRHLRPTRNRFIADPQGYDDFLNSLLSPSKASFRLRYARCSTAFGARPGYAHIPRTRSHADRTAFGKTHAAGQLRILSLVNGPRV
jgi:hypothetical protein